MGFPVAAGHVNYDGLLIPEIWSPRILEKFYQYTVFGEICNTYYEGEIKAFGNTVHIRERADIIIRKYKKGQKLVTQVPDQPTTNLVIDQGEYWQFLVERVDEAQADLNYLDEWTTDAGEKMKITVDAQVLSTVYADAAAANQGATAGQDTASYNMGTTGSPRVVTKADVIDAIVDMGSVLDEQAIPESNRWLVLPPSICGMIKKSDLQDASLAGDEESIVRNGRLGMIDRFMIYKSNQIAKEGAANKFNIMFGHISALTFAAQLVESEVIQAESTFGKLARGLFVYGYKGVKPTAYGRAILQV